MAVAKFLPAGLADENLPTPAVAAMAPVGRCVHLHRAGHRRGVGQTDVGHRWVWDARLTSELVLLFLYAGVIAPARLDDRKWPGARRAFWCWSAW